MLEPPTILLLRKASLTQGVVWQMLRPQETASSETVRVGRVRKMISTIPSATNLCHSANGGAPIKSTVPSTS